MRINTETIVRSASGETKVVKSDKQLHVSQKTGEPMLPTGQVKMTMSAMGGIDVYA